MLAQLQLSGDLAGLLRDFLEQEGDVHCELYTNLQSYSLSSRMSFAQWWALLDKIQARFPDRNIGLALGQCVRSKHLGVLGYLTLASDTLADALGAFQRYQRLLHDGEKAKVSIQNDIMVMSWTSDYGPSTQLSDEVLLAGLLAFIRQMTAKPDLSPLQVDFIFPAPETTEDYDKVFNVAAGFSQPATAIYFPLEYLNLPISNSDPGLRSLLERQAQASLAILPDSEGFAGALRSVLLRALQSGRSTSADVAAMLNMSERTLFRRLNEQGLNFKALLSQLRVQLAREYLADSRLSLSEIALLLGYSEQSAFNRAFKRETGLTPRQCQVRKLRE
ncbi:AraC family transcriptional regulator [Zhongshania aquimaris]|uniref:AraC family transcriptional regulator n=1 Tax=Zhongshania aquimaris TaxID=2857107 RepID=A0ABS6VN85_9GAMM|nr:AraC family transcriptional regulator [Zhongshania aquimaris]MBW2939778.1 AraC family transcriptional regulator [Zhongshania aquimaris]|tara:strand:- start:526 stop:1524 length:999 start_codon:yes stop_codon:yes gene_type:complete